MRATFSPAIARICSPVVSSVVSISAKAVESHAASGRQCFRTSTSNSIANRWTSFVSRSMWASMHSTASAWVICGSTELLIVENDPVMLP